MNQFIYYCGIILLNSNTSSQLLPLCSILNVYVLSHLVLSDSLQSCGLGPTKLLCPWKSAGKNTCHFLFQGTFLTQGSDPCLLLGRPVLYHCITWEAPQTKQKQVSVQLRWVDVRTGDSQDRFFMFINSIAGYSPLFCISAEYFHLHNTVSNIF